jgi:Domain of unknown function (DUF1906)
VKYGIDCTYPPTLGQAHLMRSYGYTWIICYVGGPTAAARGSWQQIDGELYPVRDIKDVFDGFLPTYVGQNLPWAGEFNEGRGRADGDEANEFTGKCGFDSPTILALDLEYGNWQRYSEPVRQYAWAWAEQVKAAGHTTCLYSDPASAAALRNGFDYIWVASWSTTPARYLAMHPNRPVGFDPREPPPWDVWQFAGGPGAIGGVPIDLNSMADDVPLATYG